MLTFLVLAKKDGIALYIFICSTPIYCLKLSKTASNAVMISCLDYLFLRIISIVTQVTSFMRQRFLKNPFWVTSIYEAHRGAQRSDALTN